MGRVALERCFNLCAERAWRLACGLLRDPHEAHDCVQQAFVAAARKPERIPRDDPWPWFSAVLVHEARNLRRKRRPSHAEEFEMQDPSPGPANNAQRGETAQQLRLALETLPEAEREAIALTYISGLTHVEAAESLGMPVKTLSSHVSRGMERLRQRLNRKEESLMASLAVLPAFAPPGGWDAALAAWKSAAFSSASTAGAAVATGAVMANKGLIAAGLALAIGIGFGGGFFAERAIHPDPQPVHTPQAASEEVSAPASTDQPAQSRKHAAQVPDETSKEVADAKVEARQAKDEATKLRAELAAVAAERDEARDRADQLEAELGPIKAEQLEREPTFTFGRYGQIDGVRKSNWKELSRANRVVVECIREIRAAQRKGEQPSREVQIRLQRHTEIVRQYEYETIGVIKSWARHNGELTHPLTVANMFAGELREAGLPLSDDQRAQIERLGLAYEGDWEAAQGKYGNTTPRCEKLLDEYLLKGAFMDSLYDVLTTEQRAQLVDPATYRVAFSDLHCPTLMLIHTSPILTGQDNAELRQKLRDMLVQRYKVEEAQLDTLAPLLESWVADVAGALTPVSQAETRFYTYDQAAIALRGTVKLVKSMRDLVALSEEARAALLDSYDVYIPRIVQ
ncbi:MAG: sigma-70 family RNA polymerase sigma factor [Planctomycetes bacterium]|nr:sigma-70 family RNA polymerase sigma factor [Planctomycetota bacterium]